MSISINLLKRFYFIGFLLFVYLHGFSQNNMKDFGQMQSPPLVYQALKTVENMEIDGKENENTWSQTPWSSSFIDIEGSNKPSPAYNTRFKMTYDDQYLYILAQMEEPHIWGNITQHDAIIYHNNDFEVFLKPDVHSDHYYEIEVNALNTVFDLMMPKPYRFNGKALIHWDTKGIKTAVYQKGTINNPADKDHYWSLEMAIPFASLITYGTASPPLKDSHWLINFSRVQWQYELEDQKYKRKTVNGRLLPEDNWVWSPIGVVNMHFPERWGYIQFVDSLTSPTLPDYYTIKQLGWNIHYLLDLYRKQHHTFPPQLKDIKTTIYDNHPSYQITYSPSGNLDSYSLYIVDKNSTKSFRIDHLGNNTYHE